MKPETTQFVRDTILRTARSYPRGVTRTTLDICLQSALSVMSLGVNSDDLELHLRYLESLKFIEQLKKGHTPELTMWSITAAGIDDLATRGL